MVCVWGGDSFFAIPKQALEIKLISDQTLGRFPYYCEICTMLILYMHPFLGSVSPLLC